MIVLIRCSNADPDTGVLEKCRLRQPHAARSKVLRGVKCQQVTANLETGARQQRSSDPTIGTGRSRRQQSQSFRGVLVQVNAYAAGGQAGTDIQNVCGQLSHA